MTTTFSMTRDETGVTGYGIAPADDKFNTTLASGVAQDICTLANTYPNWEVVFSPQVGTNIWVAYNTAATLPGISAAATDSEHNPAVRTLPKGTTISAITGDTTATLGVICYAIP